MRIALQWIRSLAFVVAIYAWMAVVAIVYAPAAIRSPAGALRACHAWCRFVRGAARILLGLRTEVRGEVPTGEVLIASKHQSFLDIILIFGALPAGKFIMKKELTWAPILGQYALRIGCVPVDRGKRGQAIEKMLADVKRGQAAPGQLIIYPQGTRVPPGIAMPYKTGSHALYAQMGQPCVPVATNVGLFWPRAGVLKRPGLGVVEFLPPIEPGLGRAAFLARLEGEIEPASDALMEEGGWVRQAEPV